MDLMKYLIQYNDRRNIGQTSYVLKVEDMKNMPAIKLRGKLNKFRAAKYTLARARTTAWVIRFSYANTYYLRNIKIIPWG